MTEFILVGDPDIPLVLRRSARAKRISLRISQLDGRVTLTLPRRCPEKEAIDFALQKETWIRKHLSEREEDVKVQPGTLVPIRGRMHEVVNVKGRQVSFGDGSVLVPGPAERVGNRLAGHLKAIARARLAEASDHYSGKLGRPYSAITLRDTRSRWGSCTSEGRLMYSWRLILAPSDVLDYVVAHEVAHLNEMNHSAAFWETVKQLYGTYDEPRHWLRKQGGGLHRYRFGT